MNPPDTQDDLDQAQEREAGRIAAQEQAVDDRSSEPLLRGKDGTALFDTVMPKSMWGPNWRKLTEPEP